MDGQKGKAEPTSIEVITKDLTNVVNKLSKEKSNTENALKDLIDKIELTFEDAKKQTDKGVSELNAKRIDLEKTVDSKLGLASNVVKKSISILKENNEWVRTEFRKSLAIPLIALVLVLLYKSEISYLSWIDYTVNGIPVVLAIIIFLALCFVYNSLQKINEKFLVNSEDLEKTIDDLKRTGPDIDEINISELKYEETRPYLKGVRGILEILIFSAGESVPFIKQAFNKLTLLAKFGEKVDNFELALNYYGLLQDKVFFARLREFASPKDYLINDDRVLEDGIIEKIIERFKKQGINLSKNIILLLYNEYNGLSTEKIFRTINRDDEELDSLAKVLIDSKRLWQPSYNLTYRPEDIVAILKKVGFNLSKINYLLSRSLRRLDYINSYTEFLVNNGISPNFKVNIEYIINELEDENDVFERQVVSLAYKIGMRVFSEIPTLDQDYIEGFARASVSIKFHNEISFNEYACEISADDRAATVIAAYHNKSEEKDRKGVVLLEELFGVDLVKLSNDKTDEEDFKFLKSQLREGKWFGSSSDLLRAYIDTTKKEIQEQLSKIEKFKILQEIVKKTFQKVKIGTIEKAIDAQVFTAYVIMFSSKRRLAPLVNKLSKRNLEASNPEYRWYEKPSDSIRAIEKQYKVTPKYDFINFSDSTRIGVLGKGESFIDFKDNFLNDLQTILSSSKTDETFGGLVVQRITPSKYSFGMLPNEESDNADIKDLDIANYITRLANDYVPEEEKVSVIRLDKDVDLFEIVNIKSIHELIEIEKDDITPKERIILESPDLKLEILEKLGTNFKSLALDLGTGRRSKKEITPIIRDILESRFSSKLGSSEKTKVRADILSKRFSDVLEQIALFYGS